eukprot:GSMAST32.ASY1.ANO1.2640.1 assembled CDS
MSISDSSTQPPVLKDNTTSDATPSILPPSVMEQSESPAVAAVTISISERYPTLNAESAKHPRPSDTKLDYGTAGFRLPSEKLDSTAFRMGLIAVLRAKHQGAITGICMTASHNPIADNGIKLADPDGGVIDPSWEGYCNLLANAQEGKVAECIQQIVDEEKIDLEKEASIFIARDTRPSTFSKFQKFIFFFVLKSALILRANVLDFGILTTPQLHSSVRMFNLGDKIHFTESGYYKMVSDAFISLLSTTEDQNQLETRDWNIIVDGANGVGAHKLAKLQVVLGDAGRLKLEIRNGGNVRFIFFQFLILFFIKILYLTNF